MVSPFKIREKPFSVSRHTISTSMPLREAGESPGQRHISILLAVVSWDETTYQLSTAMTIISSDWWGE